MAGIRPIRRRTSALCLVGPRAIARSLGGPGRVGPRHATPCHGVALRTTLCSRPTAIPNLRSRLETEERRRRRRRSHVGHSHACDSYRRDVDVRLLRRRHHMSTSSSPDRASPFIDRHRDDANRFDRVTNVLPGTRRSRCVS